MSYKLTNISGGQIVCDLAIVGKTLRLNNKQSKTIKDTEITPHIKNLVDKRLMLCEQVSVETTKSTKKVTVQKDSKEKEEKI